MPSYKSVFSIYLHPPADSDPGTKQQNIAWFDFYRDEIYNTYQHKLYN